MRRARFTLLGLLVFGLLFVSFVVRGLGQFIVGPAPALWLAGVIAAGAGLLVLGLVAFWVLARLGMTTLEEG